MDEPLFRRRDIQALDIIREALKDHVRDINLIKLECMIYGGDRAIYYYRDINCEEAKRLCSIELSDVLRLKITEWDNGENKRKEKFLIVDSWDAFREHLDKIREYAARGEWIKRTHPKSKYSRYPH